MSTEEREQVVTDITKVGLYDCGQDPARLVATYDLDDDGLVRVALLDATFPTSIACMGMDGSGFRSIRTREQVFPREGSKFLAALVELSANTSYVKWLDMSCGARPVASDRSVWQRPARG